MTYRIILAAFLLSFIAGCLPTYVGDPQKSTLDQNLLGLWHLNGDNEQLWYIHKMDAHTYLVQLYNFDNKDGMPVLKGGPHLFRAWLTPIAGKQFISMQAFDPRQITDPTTDASKNRYVVAKIELNGDHLTAAGVAPEFVKQQQIKTPADFEKALAEQIHQTPPKEDRQPSAAKSTYLDSETYDRVDPKNPGTVQSLIDQVSAQASQ